MVYGFNDYFACIAIVLLLMWPIYGLVAICSLLSHLSQFVVKQPVNILQRLPQLISVEVKGFPSRSVPSLEFYVIARLLDS